MSAVVRRLLDSVYFPGISAADVRSRIELLRWEREEKPRIIARLNRRLALCWLRRRKERL